MEKKKKKKSIAIVCFFLNLFWYIYYFARFFLGEKHLCLNQLTDDKKRSTFHRMLLIFYLYIFLTSSAHLLCIILCFLDASFYHF